ncbi:MAG: type I methionyl aminopeptidase [Candidatus Andersenbacteria bacterium]|nr:type I methionyl aminopeptidase [bacterium]MDZ4225619.1 type I methionyl aminopeptidase [Candidatus Andersenbacteria bacterium]
MIRLKTKDDIEKLREGGRMLGEVLAELAGVVKVGTTGAELDELATRLIRARGCEPAFLNYASSGQQPFPAALCVSINDAVVHGIPTDAPFVGGDVVGLDLGLIYRGKYYLDSAQTVIVGGGSGKTKELVAVTEEALQRGIAAALPGNRIGDIGCAIQRYVESAGFEVVRQLVGHGVGYAVHEEPQVPNFGRAGAGALIEPGLVIAIEPMVTKGNPVVVTGEDGWSVKIKSGNLSAHAEHTVAVMEEGPVVLTSKRKT